VKAFKWLTVVMVLLSFLGAACLAAADEARVVTPKGPLNMRKEQDEKSKLLESVPNKTLVEVEEAGETWSKITYKKKTGYVKTEYLKLPQNMVGKAVYPDEGTLLLRRDASLESEIVYPVGFGTAVTVERVEGEWAYVRADDRPGYVETRLLSYQYDAPQGEPEWTAQSAAAAQKCEIRLTGDPASRVIAALEIGDRATVTLIEKDACLVMSEKGCGFAPKAALALLGPEDDAQAGEGVISRTEAVKNAEAALKKKFKGFSKVRLYGVASLIRQENVACYSCGFYTDQDQYLFCAVLDAQTGDALFLGDYTGFALLTHEPELLPEGEIALEISRDTLAVGDVLDISVQAWTLKQTQYALYKDGAEIAKSEPGAHFSAAYRPREAGSYRLTVTVTDEKGKKNTAEAEFTVEEAQPSANGISPVYSQKDGWWKDKKYRHSNLGKSGCAIFALSHALERMGHTEEASLPQTLAEKYAYCLIPGEGTSNEMLINAAAKDFGFKTQKALINDEKKIAELIREGTYFSFSIAKGHIAMVSGISEDGGMIRVVDSAPSATYERIKGASPYFEKFSGVFRAALALDDLPGARWYFETDEYGGLEYWLPMEYVAKRGVRLIQPIAE